MPICLFLRLIISNLVSAHYQPPVYFLMGSPLTNFLVLGIHLAHFWRVIVDTFGSFLVREFWFGLFNLSSDMFFWMFVIWLSLYRTIIRSVVCIDLSFWTWKPRDFNSVLHSLTTGRVHLCIICGQNTFTKSSQSRSPLNDFFREYAANIVVEHSLSFAVCSRFPSWFQMIGLGQGIQRYADKILNNLTVHNSSEWEDYWFSSPLKQCHSVHFNSSEWEDYWLSSPLKHCHSVHFNSSQSVVLILMVLPIDHYPPDLSLADQPHVADSGLNLTEIQCWFLSSYFQVVNVGHVPKELEGIHSCNS